MVFKDLDNLLSKFLEFDKLSNDIYHYSPTYESLVKIVASKRLIMTDYKNLRNEIDYALSYLKNEVKDERFKFNKINVDGQLLSFWESFEWFLKQLRFFICSFSLSRDDSSLWRTKRFGGKNFGFSIGFSKDHFALPTTWEWENSMIRICYGETELRKLAIEILKIQLYLKNVESEADYWKIIVELFTRIIPILPKFLDPHHSRQNEFRLCAQDYSIPQSGMPERRIPSELIFEKGDVNRMYSEPISPITEIIIGPGNDFVKIVDDLRKDLPEETLKNIKIVESSHLDERI